MAYSVCASCLNNIPDGYEINTSVTFCSDFVMNSNVTGTDYAITTLSHGVIVDGNGTTIINPTYGYGFSNGAYENVTFKNFNVQGFQYAFKLQSYSSGTNITNNNISNVRFGIFSDSTNGNNYGGVSIKSNNITCNASQSGRRGIWTDESNNYNITNNIIKNCRFGIRTSLHNNTNISDNYIYNSDIGVYSDTDINMTYQNNLVDNSTINDDDFDVGYRIYNSTNIVIKSNTINQSATCGILLSATDNINITNNIINAISISDRSNYEAQDWSDPIMGICSVAVYKQWLGGGMERSPDDDENYIKDFYSSNINITGNTFNEHVQVLAKFQGATSIDHDLSDYWYRKIRPDQNLTAPDEYYIKNSFNKLTHYEKDSVNDKLYVGYYNPVLYSSVDNRRFNYTISKYNITVQPVNSSVIYNYTDYSSNFTYIDISDRSYTLKFNSTISVKFNTTSVRPTTTEGAVTYNISSTEHWILYENTHTLPYDEINPTSDTNFTRGVYFLNDSNGWGVFRPLSDNFTIDFRGGEYNGYNYGKFVDINDKDNVTVMNFTAHNYPRGVQIKDCNNITIKNIELNKSNADATSTYGILLESTNYDINITKSKTHGFYYGFRATGTGGNIWITDNMMDGPKWVNIQTWVNKTHITNNTVNDTQWNLIQYYSQQNIIENNKAWDFTHMGIDSHNDSNVTQGGFTNISGNIVWLDDPETYSSADAGIYIQATEGDRIFNNTVYDITTNTSRGIGIGGGSSSVDVLVYNNTIRNIKNFCMLDFGSNTIWQDNTLEDCQEFTAQVYGHTGTVKINNAQFINNNYIDGIAHYYMYSVLNINYTVNETSTNYHLLNFSDGGFVYIDYTGQTDNKYIQILNYSVNVSYIPNTFSQGFYNSSSPISNPSEMNFTTLEGYNGYLLSYAETTYPAISTLPTTITNMQYDYDATAQRLDFTVEGSGDVVMYNFATVRGSNGYYETLKNSVSYEFAKSDTYTLDGVGDWIIRTSAATSIRNSCSTFADDFVGGFGELGNMLAILVITMVGGFVSSMARGHIFKLDLETISTMAITMVVLIIFSIIINLTVVGGC